jgi:2-polyprenyl-6-methoxyphenol hydroxylase-like FAD-dependent oxidoreductase
MKRTHCALVAGAGIAGLTAATALHDLGWAVDLVERRETLDVIPTGLFIPANGMRAFAALGAADALRSRGPRRHPYPAGALPGHRSVGNAVPALTQHASRRRSR